MRNKLSKFYKNKDNFAAHTANHFNHKFYKIVHLYSLQQSNHKNKILMFIKL